MLILWFLSCLAKSLMPNSWQHASNVITPKDKEFQEKVCNFFTTQVDAGLQVLKARLELPEPDEVVGKVQEEGHDKE